MMTGQIISPRAATTTIADVTDATHDRRNVSGLHAAAPHSYAGRQITVTNYAAFSLAVKLRTLCRLLNTHASAQTIELRKLK